MALAEKYEKGPKIGRGSFSQVFMGTPRKGGPEVALKRVANEDPYTNLNIIEIQCLQRLRHRNIIHFIESIDEQGYLWIVTELCDLGNLEEFLKHKQPSEQLKLQIMRDSACAVDYMHRMMVVHRDIKLANILLKRQGREIVGKIIDFGLSKIIEGHTITEDIQSYTRGTVAFWAPELLAPGRARKEGYTYTVDNFALGQVFLIVVEYDRAKHGHMKDLYPQDFDLSGTSSLSHWTKEYVHGIIRGLTAQVPQSRMSLSKVVHDLAFVLGKLSGQEEGRPFTPLSRGCVKCKQLMSRIETLETSQPGLSEETSRLELQIAELAEEKSQLQQQLSELTEDKSDLHIQVSELIEDKSELQQQLSRLTKDKSELQKQLADEKEKLLLTQAGQKQGSISPQKETGQSTRAVESTADEEDNSRSGSFYTSDIIKHIPAYIDSLEMVKDQLHHSDLSDDNFSRVVDKFDLVTTDLIFGLQNIYSAKHELSKRSDDVPPRLLGEMRQKLKEILQALTLLHGIHSSFGGDIKEFFDKQYYSLRNLLKQILSKHVYLAFFCGHLKPVRLEGVATEVDQRKDTTLPGVEKKNKELTKKCKQYELQEKKLTKDLLEARTECKNQSTEIRQLAEQLSETKAKLMQLQIEQFKSPRPTVKPVTARYPIARSNTIFVPRKDVFRGTIADYAKQKKKNGGNPAVNKDM